MLDHTQTVILLLLTLLVVGSSALLVARRLRRTRRPVVEAPRARVLPAPAPVEPPRVARHPIILAHGFMGFDAIGLGLVREEYFRGVRPYLEQAGHRVHLVRVSPVAGVRKRAEQLAEQICAIDAERVNIVAHSMGGLDARYAISQLGLGTRVASLTTIGTPHHGTPLADGMALLRAAGIPSDLMAVLEGLHDLGTKQMAAFNASVLDAPEVAYASYRGFLPRGGSVHQLLLPTFAFMHRLVGDNDGIVPARSQHWGQPLGDVAADHWAQIGWAPGLDVKRFYFELALALALRGF